MRLVFPVALVAVCAAIVFYKLYRNVDVERQTVFKIEIGKAKLRAESTDFLPKSVSSDLESMEKYLGKLVTEYENVLPSADANIPLANLPNLSDFIGGSAGSDFRSKFVRPYHDAARGVDKEIEKDLAL
jgi:hypothetical protein